jgi:hypothetical protein
MHEQFVMQNFRAYRLTTPKMSKLNANSALEPIFDGSRCMPQYDMIIMRRRCYKQIPARTGRGHVTFNRNQGNKQ